MNLFKTSLFGVCFAMAAGSSFAQDAKEKQDLMAKEGSMRKDLTMQECKDHMAMPKKDGMKRDDAMMKKDTACADMMKKDGAGSSSPMKK